MAKYIYLLKGIVDFYFNNQQCMSLTYHHFNLPEKSVHRWITQYKQFGIEGLAISRTKKRYTAQQKLSVVQSVISGQYSAEQMTLKF